MQERPRPQAHRYAENASFFEQFYANSHHLAKTGSGQTEEKTLKPLKRGCVLFRCLSRCKGWTTCEVSPTSPAVRTSATAAAKTTAAPALLGRRRRRRRRRPAASRWSFTSPTATASATPGLRLTRPHSVSFYFDACPEAGGRKITLLCGFRLPHCCLLAFRATLSERKKTSERNSGPIVICIYIYIYYSFVIYITIYICYISPDGRESLARETNQRKRFASSSSSSSSSSCIGNILKNETVGQWSSCMLVPDKDYRVSTGVATTEQEDRRRLAT
jgi:hypothetical protein